MKKSVTILGLVLLLGAFAACEDEEVVPAAEDPLVVTITASAATVAADEPVTLTITIENRSDERLEWGSGSSGCRLFGHVEVDGVSHTIPPDEICTADIVTYVLEPGASDTQTKTWSGRIGVDGKTVDLPVGTYEIHGTGGKVASAPVTIEVAKAGG